MTTTNAPDGYDVVERHWPYDRPHTPERVAGAAAALSELVRYLNNATRRAGALPAASSTSRLLCDVSVAVSALPQLLRQVDAAVERHASDPDLYDDRRDRPAFETVTAVRASLVAAQQAAYALSADLDRAAQTASHLGHDTTGHDQ